MQNGHINADEWPKLSSPIEEMKEHYTVVVIGSGYGGSISACRMARAGKVSLLIDLDARVFANVSLHNRMSAF